MNKTMNFKTEIKEFSNKNVKAITMMGKCQAIDVSGIENPTAENLKKAFNDETLLHVTDCIKIIFIDKETGTVLDTTSTLSFDRDNIKQELKNYSKMLDWGYNNYYIDITEGKVHWVDENGDETSIKHFDWL